MNDDELPPDLARLEEELAARQSPAPGPELKGRVLQAVRRELTARSSRRILRSSLWRFAAATAATVALWLNLGMSATNDTVWDLHKNGHGSEGLAAAEYLRELVPEMSEAEARRQALLLKAGARLVLAPSFNNVSGIRGKQYLEDEPWPSY